MNVQKQNPTLFPDLKKLNRVSKTPSVVAVQVLQMVKALAPIRTGNLRLNAIVLNPLADGKFEITIGRSITGEMRAPYVVYTNEPWISPIWHGKKNPNEGWIDDAVEMASMFLGQQLGASVEKEGKRK